MTSVRALEREIWRSLATYANQREASALMFDDSVIDDWSEKDWGRFDQASRNVAARAARYAGPEPG